MRGKDFFRDRGLRRVKILIMMIMIILPGIVLSQTAQDSVHLQQLIDEAIANNPRLQSFYLASRADSFSIPQSGALPRR